MLSTVAVSALSFGLLTASAFDVNAIARKFDAMESSCYLPLDVFFLQDTTESYADDLPHIVSQLNQTMNSINLSNPNSEFGVAEFKDRPQEPFGWPADYCYRLASDLSSDPNGVLNAYKTLYASGGNDIPEDSYLAAILSFQWNKVHWRNMGTGPNETGARLLILATDALPHYYGDGSEKNLTGLPMYTSVDQSDINVDCTGVQYPTPEDFKAAVQAVPNQYVMFLIPSNVSSVLSAWQWVNSDLLGQPEDFVQVIDSDSSNFIQAVLQALTSVTEFVCAQTTTAAPSTSAPSTVATIAPTSTVAPTSTEVTTTATTLATTFAPTTISSEAPTTVPSTAVASTEAPSTAVIPTSIPVTSVTSTLVITTSNLTRVTSESTSESTTESTYGSTYGSTYSNSTTNGCKPCPIPCPQPCNMGCCCGGHQGEVVIKVSDRPKHIEADIEY